MPRTTNPKKNNGATLDFEAQLWAAECTFCIFYNCKPNDGTDI